MLQQQKRMIAASLWLDAFPLKRCFTNNVLENIFLQVTFSVCMYYIYIPYTHTHILRADTIHYSWLALIIMPKTCLFK